jgi:hypothetical protein
MASCEEAAVGLAARAGTGWGAPFETHVVARLKFNHVTEVVKPIRRAV